MGTFQHWVSENSETIEIRGCSQTNGPIDDTIDDIDSNDIKCFL